MTRTLLTLFIISTSISVISAQKQSARYEMEKKNTDDYFQVISAGEDGVVIIRDYTKEFAFGKGSDGDEWMITSLDTALTERWTKEFSVEYKFVFKGYDLVDGKLFLLFRQAEYEKSDYHLMIVDVVSEEISTYNIENELELNLSHIIIIDDVMVLAGYVKDSPTLVSYNFGDDKINVVPGFFKDRSEVIDLKSNHNGTFNVLTLEKEHNSYHLRLRTHSKSGQILFERVVDLEDEYRVLSAVSTGFINGNLAIAGIFGGKNSYYAQGIYFALVKPQGQDNLTGYIDFVDLEHFFDYMRPKRAARIKRKIKRRRQAGKEYKYTTRLLLNKVHVAPSGDFVLSAEIYDPQNDRNYQSFGYNDFYSPYYYRPRYGTLSNYRYMRQPGRMHHVDDANHFEFLEAVLLQMNKEGQLIWDCSFPIDDVESASLEPVTDEAMNADGLWSILYKSEEKIHSKTFISQDSALVTDEPLLLKYATDEIQHNYNLMGGTQHWYGNNFYVWGYHRVENNGNKTEEKRRNVLFINKVTY